ncbi:MmpS family transport accessory protein [Mycolicibacterium brumae]|uniref:MmpS family transport accessory protein n=1 Tax=Mycolicibacterium brumae TaxID=85968 RepID=UPI000A8AA433|nr:MmpS family transport accessory protein [Mycolicibacterium brumae]
MSEAEPGAESGGRHREPDAGAEEDLTDYVDAEIVDDDVEGNFDEPEDPDPQTYQAYSAPEAEHITSAPYVPADLALYEYDDFEHITEYQDARPPRWPWIVGVTAILAAIALVVSVSVLVTRTETRDTAGAGTTTTVAPTTPEHDAIPTSVPPPEPSPEPPPPEPPPPTTTPPPTRSAPKQITYSVTGTKSPGDIITVTYTDANGRSKTLRNVYIPWSFTVTPISQSEVGSVSASSLFLVSRLNCSITTSDGQTLSSNQSNSAQTAC